MNPAAPRLSSRVLVLLPTERDSQRTRQLFEEGGLECHTCRDLAEICRELGAGAGAVLLNEAALADDTSGQLAEALRAQAPWSPPPLIVVSREGASQQLERGGLADQTNVIVVERPIRMRPLLSLTRSALRGHTALLKSQLVLAEQAEQLRQADRRKDEFLATLAHELRNPLAPIRTGIDLLRTSRSEESSLRALAVMDRQIKHMVRLVDDLLDVSRITRGRLELKKARIELGTVLDTAIESSRPDLERNGHRLCTNIENRSLLLDADLTRLAQVVSNLLNNAIRYTPPRGELEVRAAQQGAEAVIELHDNGIGIPEEQLSHVFEMFSQVNRNGERSQEGLGIGLALVRTLVEMHGGSVLAASDGPGRGSTFSLRLPLVEPTSAVEATSRPSNGVPAHKKRILVVDDNEDAADMLTLMLRQAEYDTSQANDGPSALAAVEAFTPDVVILDIGLPGMSGYEVARALRRTRSKEQLELIALTGWGSTEDKHKASEAGFDAHLTKPVDADMLYRTLADLEQQERT